MVLLEYKAYMMTEVGQTTTADKHNCNHDHDSHHNCHLYKGDDHNMVHQAIKEQEDVHMHIPQDP